MTTTRSVLLSSHRSQRHRFTHERVLLWAHVIHTVTTEQNREAVAGGGWAWRTDVLSKGWEVGQCGAVPRWQGRGQTRRVRGRLVLA